MDWKVFMATLGAVFVAELADKTQLVGISLSAKSGRPLSVFWGSLAGYALVTVISVMLGALFSRYVDPVLIKYAGGALFVLMGLLMILGKL